METSNNQLFTIDEVGLMIDECMNHSTGLNSNHIHKIVNDFKSKIHKQISLDKYEVMWINLIKNNLHKEYHIDASNWPESLKPMFKLIYGYDSTEHYNDYLVCIFRKLLGIYLKIQDDKSGRNIQIIDLFEATFDKFRRNYDLPIERAIAELCGQIQCNTVINKDGSKRYEL